MSTRTLLIRWAIGLAIIFLLGTSRGDGFLRRASAVLVPQQHLDEVNAALRRDSLAAVAGADSANASTGDTVRAIVMTPPMRGTGDDDRLARIARNRQIVVPAILIGLLFSTYRWKQRPDDANES